MTLSDGRAEVSYDSPGESNIGRLMLLSFASMRFQSQALLDCLVRQLPDVSMPTMNVH